MNWLDCLGPVWCGSFDRSGMHPDLKIPKAVTTRFTPSLCYGRFPDFRIGSATSPESFIYPPLLFKSCTPIPLPTQMSPLSSPSSSTMSSPVHHASLVNPATHSPALLELIDLKINRPIIGMWPSFSYFFLFSYTCFTRLCCRLCSRNRRLRHGASFIFKGKVKAS